MCKLLKSVYSVVYMQTFTLNAVLFFSDPPIDPRYLSKRDDAIALRGVSSTRSNSPPVIHSGLGSNISSRLSQQQVVVPKAVHSQPPPLASAYFPGQKGS